MSKPQVYHLVRSHSACCVSSICACARHSCTLATQRRDLPGEGQPEHMMIQSRSCGLILDRSSEWGDDTLQILLFIKP